MTSSSSDRARRRAVRTRMAMTGQPYTTAARALGATGSATATIDPLLLAPYPDETGVSSEELGWRVLPADATPEQQARAEAVWRPVRADRPCRCSGPCSHGVDCENGDGEGGECPGQMIHVDRYPGSMFSLIVWSDTYQCGVCGESYEAGVDLPEIPWGAGSTPGESAEGRSVLRVYPGVRHPNFPDEPEDEDGPSYHPDYCPDCGFDTCACDRDSGCPECGAGRAGDPYGECVCEPQ